MSHKNYTRYSNMNGKGPTAVNHTMINGESDPVIDENESAVIEQPIEGQTVIPEVEPIVEPEPTIEPEIRKIGAVYGCKRLNIRELPSTTATIVSEISEGNEVMIDEKQSNALFYKVCTEHGIEGYCMKKFIVVKS